MKPSAMPGEGGGSGFSEPELLELEPPLLLMKGGGGGGGGIDGIGESSGDGGLHAVTGGLGLGKIAPY